CVTALSFGLHRRRASRKGRSLVEPSSDNQATLRSPWSDRIYLAYLALQLVSAVIFFQVIGSMPIFWAEQLGLSESQIGLLFVINTLLIVAVEMVLTDRLSRRAPLRMVAWGIALVCLGFGALVLAPANLSIAAGFWFAAALVPVWTAGEMLSSPFSLTFVAQRSVRGRRGAYMGLFSTTMATAFVLAPLVGTSLYEIDPYLPWWCCLAMAAVLPLGYVALERRLTNSQTPPAEPSSESAADLHAVATMKTAQPVVAPPAVIGDVGD
ncbi:MAG: MFS transporter, partial [Planctomycetota bacterium]